MKRVIALVLTVGLLCSLAPALALDVPKHIDEFNGLPALPRLSDFAAMHTWQEDELVTIYLDKPVDNLRANWLEYNNEHEEDLEVSEDGYGYWTATLDTTGHKYQVGAHWTNAYATETYIPNDSTKKEDQYQTMLRTSDAAEGRQVGDTMAQRDTMTPVNSSAPVQKNDSAIDELKGYLYNDQPDKFTKHEVKFTATTNNSTIEQDIRNFTQLAAQEAQTATDAYGKSHYDQYGSRADLQNYYCVKVEEPFYAVVKTLDDGKFCILSRYKYNTNLSNITVPSGFKLYRVNGYVTAWHPTYAASDGTSDGRYTVAYLSDQTIDGEKWTVTYGRNGKIQYFYLTMYDTELFGQDMGTAKIQFEPCNTGWFIREVTEMYEDGSYVSAFFNRTGNGKLSYYKASEFFPSGSASSGRSQHGSDYDPYDDSDPEGPNDEFGDEAPFDEDFPPIDDEEYGDEGEFNDPYGEDSGNDEEFTDLNTEDFGDDEDEFSGNSEAAYFAYEDFENDNLVLHRADCPVVLSRDKSDDKWAAYAEGDLERDMYELCEICHP